LPVRRSLFLFTVVALLSLTPLPPAGGFGDSTGVTTRVSVKTGGGQADAQGPAGAGQPAVSDTLGVVAFVSDATNLVTDDRNGVSDVFVRQNGVVSRVSLGPNFAEANGPSSSPALSRDGQYVAFTSAADNLVPGDTNGALDVFVYDRASSTVTRVSVTGDGSQADGDSRSPSISDTAGPLVVAFTSVATNLAAGDGNGQSDVFVRTLSSPPSTTIVSVGTGGAAAGNDGSDEPSLDGSGTKVAFSSDATDLVDGDTNGKTDVFWRDLTAGVTERVSLRDRSTTQGADDSFSPSISGDGTRIAFASDASNLTGQSDDNDTTDVFLRDRSAGDVVDQRTTFVSKCGSNVGDDQSFAPRITGDIAAGGSGVAYISHAGNLLGGCGDPSAPPDNNNEADVYFWPLGGGQNERISRDTAGAQFPRPSLQAAVSGDGRLVAFATGAADPATGEPGPGSEVFGRDRSVTPGVTTRFSAPTNGTALGPAVTEFPALSGDGKVVVYASAASDLVSDDSNGLLDVFVSDRSRNETTRVTVGLNGAQPDGPSAADSAPAVSADGHIVAFSSEATNLVSGDTNGLPDVFVYDRVKKEAARVSVGPDGVEATGGQQGAGSYMPSLSADGRFVAFASDADNLVAGDTNNATDVFVHDRQTKTTTRVSVGQGGMAGDDSSSAPSISGDGTVVAFLSEAQNLAPGDANGEADVFVRELKAATTTAVSAVGDRTGNRAASAPALSADGRWVAFAGAAGDLVAGDTTNAADVLVADRRSGTVERVSAGPDGAPANRASDAPSISADGRFVAFSSEASNLVPGDTNQRGDIFVRDRTIGATSRVSLGLPAPEACAAAVQADRANLRPALSADGRVVAFQSAATNLVPGDTNSAPDIFVHESRPVRGYWLVASDGGVFTFGSACFAGSAGATNLVRPIVGMAATPTGRGYWLVASDGGIFSFGDATFYGSTGALKLAKPIVGMAATRTGRGYWLVASDGGIFAFGDATFFGSTGGVTLTQPVVGMAATPTGKGYWLAARDGGIFTFGDAAFSGSAGGIPLAQPIVGMAATPAGGGYWLVGSDGGIFAFGNAAFFGSTGATTLNRPIVGLSPSPSGGGYWLVGSDGGIFAFGDATFFGSTGATKLVQPIVGMAARP
jgi:Tol biopolymer transport system component